MKRLFVLLPIAALLLFGVSTARAQTGGGYDLTWNSIDGGGTTFSTGGGYSLGGTIGQADAGALSGGAYSLSGGFWAGIPTSYNAFVPVTLR